LHQHKVFVRIEDAVFHILKLLISGCFLLWIRLQLGADKLQCVAAVQGKSR